MSDTTELDGKVLRSLRRRAKRTGEPLLWYGVADIASSIASKRPVRKALYRLREAGAVERSEVANGVFWRAAA